MQKFDFSYDVENDDLFLFNPSSKSKGGVEIGDITIDYNSKKEVVGIQMAKASSLIREMVEGKDAGEIKELLKNLNGCKVDIKARNNLLIIKVHLSSRTSEISPIISVPDFRETSPALAYA